MGSHDREPSPAPTHGAWPIRAAVFGASGGIGGALGDALVRRAGIERVWLGSRAGRASGADVATPFRFDLGVEATIARAAAAMAAAPPDLVIVATGTLALPGQDGPEKTLRAVDPAAMAYAFAINTIGPALVAKHMLPLLPRRRAVFAVLSAKVGSIADNRLGGWHSYRASKAALNMLVRNWAIELGRTRRDAVVAALHPGTVDTNLSAPFQERLPDGQLTAPGDAAHNLLAVIERLTPADSGGLFAWDGARLPY